MLNVEIAFVGYSIFAVILITLICVLTVQLEQNLLQRVSSLVQCSEPEFWQNGRFLVRTNRQLASHKDGIY